MILDTSEDLFAQLGYFGVTIKDVADRMGIHPALIHYYFDGKKALFDAVFERRVEYAVTTRTAGLDAYEAKVGGSSDRRGRAARLLRRGVRRLHQRATRAGAISAASSPR